MPSAQRSVGGSGDGAAVCMHKRAICECRQRLPNRSCSSSAPHDMQCAVLQVGALAQAAPSFRCSIPASRRACAGRGRHLRVRARSKMPSLATARGSGGGRQEACLAARRSACSQHRRLVAAHTPPADISCGVRATQAQGGGAGAAWPRRPHDEGPHAGRCRAALRGLAWPRMMCLLDPGLCPAWRIISCACLLSLHPPWQERPTMPATPSSSTPASPLAGRDALHGFAGRATVVLLSCFAAVPCFCCAAVVLRKTLTCWDGLTVAAAAALPCRLLRKLNDELDYVDVEVRAS